MMSLCVYCSSPATDTDIVGDDACALHSAQSHRYVVVSDLSGDEGSWLSVDLALALEDALADAGWEVAVRVPRRDECEGTYRMDPDRLQYLGCSVPVPESLALALADAAARVYATAGVAS